MLLQAQDAQMMRMCCYSEEKWWHADLCEHSAAVGRPQLSTGGSGTYCPRRWLSVDLSLSRRGIWRRTCTSSWVRVECSVLAVIKYLEALPPPHWSFLPLPLSGQRSDFPGASVKLQLRFHGLLPPQANPSSLPHFLVIKDVLLVRGERARGEHRGQRKMSFFFCLPQAFILLDVIHVDLWAN